MTRRKILISGEAGMVVIEKNDEHFHSQVGPVLQSKLEEFRILGYMEISEPELWEYLLKKKWKKVKEEIKLHQVIQDILSVKVSDYLSYATVEAYKATEFSLNTEGDWKELLK
jgi:hypothetical protein